MKSLIDLPEGAMFVCWFDGDRCALWVRTKGKHVECFVTEFSDVCLNGEHDNTLGDWGDDAWHQLLTDKQTEQMRALLALKPEKIWLDKLIKKNKKMRLAP